MNVFFVINVKKKIVKAPKNVKYLGIYLRCRKVL